jgi:hypothetical protein
MPMRLTHKRSSTRMTATNPHVDILQYSTSFVWYDTLH